MNDEDPHFVTAAWVAERWNVSSKTVLRAIAAGDLPALQLGTSRVVRIRVEDVETFEQSRKVA